MSRDARINVLLLLVVAALAVLPPALGLGEGREEPFAGADAQAEAAITENAPDYEPWFTPLYEPPSGEIESALFSLQAALGAGVLAYYFGLRRGRRQGEERVRAATGPATTPGPPTPAGPTTGAGAGARVRCRDSAAGSCQGAGAAGSPARYRP
ncbi:energy-coupling factor ABC transporter substrate-binding protein, partial [Streptomyces sp. Act-28]